MCGSMVARADMRVCDVHRRSDDGELLVEGIVGEGVVVICVEFVVVEDGEEVVERMRAVGDGVLRHCGRLKVEELSLAYLSCFETAV